MNKFIGIGRTTKDIEIKKTQNGKEYAMFQLAVARPHSTQKETDFIPCQVWNKQANLLQQYCQKGSQIAITGILQSYKDKDNKIQWMVRVYSCEFLQTNNNLKKDTLSEKPQEKIEFNSSDTKELFNNDNQNIGNDEAILWD
ncbi:single-stranded DNA-binding protein [Spiroplasma phoeniceum]|uniref:Single-stranded DNA-binding protein n=1 Tax=Spiroplasma phoeniceum P40 TaxID=1276259 RepID=A0A345DNG9_9MOLU|nr:single-stranded DNA-binding protein [Spiroplasma phoeniceum]AXF95757.1 putative single-strand binding protein SSB [Spiroplasma phoeniceum P40]AXF95961.1 putative single-strand binding protein SSB [Spiroplasma phoeniceum P40]AXF97009.1 putative single-strand binding protein SSB [Spiroplasma phoeniceum P40]AXF97038.1 putative single-strand binding protein SSB [Spiroplasma phoeniceum P40]AXF97076.1 putative single-strand binding protein SSB [Spiroplasma phoeniceum P40]